LDHTSYPLKKQVKLAIFGALKTTFLAIFSKQSLSTIRSVHFRENSMEYYGANRIALSVVDPEPIGFKGSNVWRPYWIVPMTTGHKN
jgi:hypothetical protein